jgi:hypothetical protein
MKGIAAAVFVAIGLGLFTMPSTGLAEERTCRGEIGATTVDNLRVPQGATCTLNGTTVTGTIKVERSATLKAQSVNVIGNVQAENHKLVVVKKSTVGGNIQIEQGGGAQIVNVRIKQALQFDANNNQLVARRNRITTDLQAFQNRGGVEISNNTIDGNLQCKENSPAPVGGGNRVGGNKEDQCAHL